MGKLIILTTNKTMMLRITSQIVSRHSNKFPIKPAVSHFSSHGAVQKLKFVLEDYRLHNYSREVPSRFRKQIIQTLDKNANGVINFEDFNQFLKNIGAVNNFSGDELNAIIYEAGNIEGCIPVSKIEQLMCVLG